MLPERKLCTTCGEHKPLCMFGAHRGSPDGYRWSCKSCKAIQDNIWRSKNKSRLAAYTRTCKAKYPERYRERKRRWYATANGKASVDRWINNNRDKVRLFNRTRSKTPSMRAWTKAWRKANPEKTKAWMKRWVNNNKDCVLANSAKRRASKLQAIPVWSNEFFIKEAYHLARLRTRVFGFKWHVDHIVPLKSKLVCGLHVEHNLQIIPAIQNISKHNKYWPGMP